MNQALEYSVIELAATTKRIHDLRVRRASAKLYHTELAHQIADEDLLRDHELKMVDLVDYNFGRALEEAKGWHDLSEIAQLVVDVAARAAGADFVVSRGASIRRPVSPLHSVGRLAKDAVDTALQLANGPADSRKALRLRLTNIYLAADDLISAAFSERGWK